MPRGSFQFSWKVFLCHWEVVDVESRKLIKYYCQDIDIQVDIDNLLIRWDEGKLLPDNIEPTLLEMQMILETFSSLLNGGKAVDWSLISSFLSSQFNNNSRLIKSSFAFFLRQQWQSKADQCVKSGQQKM